MLTRFLETALSAHRILVRILARPSRISYVSVHRDNVKRIEIQIEREREKERKGRNGRNGVEKSVSVRRRNGKRRRGRLYLNTAECLVMNHRQSEPSRGQLASAKTVIPVDDHSNALRTAIWPGDSDNNLPPTALSTAGEEEGEGSRCAIQAVYGLFCCIGAKVGCLSSRTNDPP